MMLHRKMCLFEKRIRETIIADSLWPWHPLTLHSLANSEPLPSDRRVLPYGELSHHAAVKEREQLKDLRGCSNTAKSPSI